MIDFDREKSARKSSWRAVCQPVDTRKYDARAGNRESRRSPRAQLHALLNRALALPRRALMV